MAAGLVLIPSSVFPARWSVFNDGEFIGWVHGVNFVFVAEGPDGVTIEDLAHEAVTYDRPIDAAGSLV